MNKEDVVPLHKGKNIDILKFAGKWVDLENIILSEVTQTQKDKYCMYSLISDFLEITQRKQAYNSQTQRTWRTIRTLGETYTDLIYMGSRKRQDLLSKLGVWGSWKRVEGEQRKGMKKRKIYSSIKTIIKRIAKIIM